MPFVVAEFDPREISFFHHDRAFRRYDPLQTPTESVYPGLGRNAPPCLSGNSNTHPNLIHIRLAETIPASLSLDPLTNMLFVGVSA